MKFATIKKRFADALKKAEQKPTAGVVWLGEYQAASGKFELEERVTVSIDPEGDAWVFLGRHEQFARQIQQDGNPETTIPEVLAMRKRVRVTNG